MRTMIIAALTISGISAAPALAQSQGLGLRGFRIEANAGSDRYKAADGDQSKFGYGATVGIDTQISRFVIGVEGSYWRDSRRVTNCVTGGAGSFCSSSGQRELGAAARAGFLVTPQLLLFGKGGFVRDRQREVFTSNGQTFYVDGRFIAGPNSSDIRFNESGYEVGGGIEYSLMSHVYADAQYVYSRYRNHNSRNRLMTGIGYRF